MATDQGRYLADLRNGSRSGTHGKQIKADLIFILALDQALDDWGIEVLPWQRRVLNAVFSKEGDDVDQG